MCVTSCFGPVRGPGEAVARPPRAAYLAAEAELARRSINLQRGIEAQRSAQVDLAKRRTAFGQWGLGLS